MSPNLFADFNGGPQDFAQKVDFYHHEQNWTNRLILGDSLLVMTSLAEKEGLKGKVQTIYLDPPYGIKFGSNWQVSTRKRDVKDGKAEDATRQPEQVRAFRDTWKLGIHSYLAYLRDRLVVSRDLLTETGSVFVQIGDENVHLVRSVMDEVFGADNFVCQVAFVTTGGQSADLLGNVFDFLVWYAKDKGNAKYRQLFQDKELREGGGWAHARAELEDGTRENIGVPEVRRLLGEGKRIRPYSLDGTASQGTTTSSSGPFEFDGRLFKLPHNSHWKTNPEGMKRLVWANRVEASENSIRFVRLTCKRMEDRFGGVEQLRLAADEQRDRPLFDGRRAARDRNIHDIHALLVALGVDFSRGLGRDRAHLDHRLATPYAVEDPISSQIDAANCVVVGQARKNHVGILCQFRQALAG
jgi:adenine-specific DNA-methyltransferase